MGVARATVSIKLSLSLSSVMSSGKKVNISLIHSMVFLC